MDVDVGAVYSMTANGCWCWCSLHGDSKWMLMRVEFTLWQPVQSLKVGQGCLILSPCLESWLSFDSPFLSPFFFCPVLFFVSCDFSANGPFSCLFFLFVSCDFSANGPFSWLFSFFLQNSQIFLLRLRPFYMALVKQLRDGRWYVQLAAIWHWYLPLCIYVKKKKSYYFCPFLFCIFL